MDTEIVTASLPRTYFRPTTASQRRLLFHTVAAGATVTAAAAQAHVGRGTYYYWLDRYETAGDAGLATPAAGAPQHFRRPPISAALATAVVTYYDAHPHERGCRTIAARLRQAHSGQAVIGHSKVAEILRHLRPPAAPAVAPPPPATPVVHAPAANQTANIDLCVVPLTHEGTVAWAAASVSQAAAGAAPTGDPAPAAPLGWPGQVFGDGARAYPEQMAAYQTQRAAKGRRKQRRRQKQAARQARNAHGDELRVARRQQRQARRAADAAWQAQRIDQQAARQARQDQTRAERQARRAAWAQRQADWATTRQARSQELAQRASADAAWRQARQAILQALAELTATPLISAWLAIRGVIDNGTRRCLQLPVFVTGAHVTAAEVVAQLRQHWPADLQFVISDNGAQFIADAFAQFAQDLGFLHIRIAPHRPQTNGIAERFVRTLKEWLAWHTWQTPEELTALLAEFIVYYNDRPHQGAELAGLSPNEFAELLKCATG
jgi:transposase InsO family protein